MLRKRVPVFGKRSGENPAKRFFGLFGSLGSEDEAAEERKDEQRVKGSETGTSDKAGKQESATGLKDEDQRADSDAPARTGDETASEAAGEPPTTATPVIDPSEIRTGRNDTVAVSDESAAAESDASQSGTGEGGDAEDLDGSADEAESTETKGAGLRFDASDKAHEAASAEPDSDPGTDDFQEWLDSLSTGNEQDTMLRFAPSRLNSINLTHVHPSGLTQFMVGRKTRLSTLLRDPDAFEDAKRAARLIRAKVNELEEERGISVGYLACGLVTWRSITPNAQGELRSVHLSAPALLARVSITIRPEQDDYELQLQDRAVVNPALVRRLQQREDLQLETDSIVAAAYATAKLDPLPAMDELRAQLSGLRSVVVENNLLVSTFADLSEAHDGYELNRDHPFLAALYRGDEAVAQLRSAQPEVTLAPLDERDPSEEYLVLDADASQQAVLDRIVSGQDVVVDAALGTGASQTAANAAAVLAAAGKSVLVVAERRSGLDDLLTHFDRVELASAVLDLQEVTDDAKLRHRAVEAILRNERAEQPNLESIHRTLKKTRHQLIDHVNSLHSVRDRWGCSPLQAMQALAELTALEPAPKTGVRLKRSVLDKTVNRDDLSNKLVRAAQLGAFDADVQARHWSGAKLRNRRDAESAFEHAVAAEKQLPKLRERIREITDHAQIKVGQTFGSWAEQLKLLAEVRTVLDHFQPDIFERNVRDLIHATGSSAWRKEAGVEIPSSIRSRLRKVAKAYIRPGVQVDDLHSRLMQVERLRESWNKYALSHRHPAVPLGISQVQELYNEVAEHLNELDRVLRPVEGNKLVDTDVDTMIEIVNQLAKDEKTLLEVPELTLIQEQLNEAGLQELMADLQERSVTTDEVADELELAWWKSALEAMISGDDYLAMMGGKDLRRIEAEYQLADQAHIESGGRKVAFALGQQWRRALAEHITDATTLRTGLKDHDLDIAGYFGLAPSLQTALMPITVASPLGLAAHVPSSRKYDVVIFLDAGELTLSSALGGINRADQVVVFGDAHSHEPKPFTVSVDPTAPTRSVEKLTSLFDAGARILPPVALKHQYRAVDSMLMRTLDAKVYQQGISRLPALSDISGENPTLRVHQLVDSKVTLRASSGRNVETSHREVAAVVQAIVAHAKERPRESLAVIAGNEAHARALAEGVKRQLAEDRSVVPFFQGGEEPFAVAPLERAVGLDRDRVIFSLGYTASGNEFNPEDGYIASEAAIKMVAKALLSGRKRLDIVVSLTPSMLQGLNLTGGLATLFAVLAAPKVGPSSLRHLPAPLLDDLYYRLGQLDLAVLRDYGEQIPAVIEYRPNPLTAEASTEPVSTPVAVVTDGDESFARMSVRERSRLQPLRLRGLGWQTFTIWTIEVFSDPGALAQKIYSLATNGSSADKQGGTAVAAKPTQTKRAKGRRARFQFTDGILPSTAAEDQPHRWGDGEERRDQWLKDQRPPHWGND
ncbi:DUF4011 domain-containing protein [Micrococcoides hystricis]|uniref:DUF4011 domain-containing protein n=1 Tax=Micrococcoides hystricis TaxID=1572761 RepID=A0ABV6PA21_9MICC